MTVEGVVVGDFRASGQLGGVFLQAADGDGDLDTFNGVFASAPDAPGFAVRNLVRVTGRGHAH